MTKVMATYVVYSEVVVDDEASQEEIEELLDKDLQERGFNGVFDEWDYTYTDADKED